MAANYLPYDPQQMLLLPEAIQDWLPEGHLAHFIGDTVDTLDLGAFQALAAIARSEAFSRWAQANAAPGGQVDPAGGIWQTRLPVVADAKDYVLAQLDAAIDGASPASSVALKVLRFGVDAFVPATAGDIALNEIGAGVVKASAPLLGMLRRSSAEVGLSRSVDDFIDAVAREGDVAKVLRGEHGAEALSRSGLKVIEFDAGQAGAWNKALSRQLESGAIYADRRTGFLYLTDDAGRVTSAHGSLSLEEGVRNGYQQRVVGGQSRFVTDEGGHLFAKIFGGPGERINLAAMDADLNRKAWRRMEEHWASALERGETVKASIDLAYSGSSVRPDRFVVNYSIGGAQVQSIFNNIKR